LQKFTATVRYLKRIQKKPLSKEEKKSNHQLSSRRVVIENIIREVKIFRIIAEKYRNRRKKYGLQFNIIAAIYNLNLYSK
jgi:membrane-bound lytic murein transglycosylase B